MKKYKIKTRYTKKKVRNRKKAIKKSGYNYGIGISRKITDNDYPCDTNYGDGVKR